MKSITIKMSTTGIVLVTLLLVFASTTTTEADFVYEFIDGAAGDQNGNTLTGTISFDSACGITCTADNITDFSISWTGSNSASLSYSSSSDIVVFSNVDSFINVTSEGITFNYDGTPTGLNNLTLRNIASSNQPAIGWGNQISGAGNIFKVYRGVDASGAFNWDDTTPGPGAVTIAATIPEPDSIVLMGFMTVVLAYGRYRVRRPNGT